MGALDWHKNVTISLTGGYADLGTVQGGPFADNTTAHVVLGGMYGPRESLSIDTNGDGTIDIITKPFHYGVDLWAPSGRGTPIYAVGDGRISFISKASDYPLHGNWIEIDHLNGWRSRYAHLLADPTYVIGDTVVKGEHINFMDNTGASTGDHLHFELLQNGLNVDPRFVMIAAPDVGQVVPPILIAGDMSPDLHRTLHDQLQYLFREGTSVSPLTIERTVGTEYFYDKESEPHLLPAGLLVARYVLLFPVEDVDF